MNSSKNQIYKFYVDGGLFGRTGYFAFTHENGNLILAIEKNYDYKTNSMIVELSAIRELIKWIRTEKTYEGHTVVINSDCQQVVKYLQLGTKFEKGKSTFANMLINIAKEIYGAKFKIIFKYISRDYNKAHNFTQPNGLYQLHFLRTQREKKYYTAESNKDSNKQKQIEFEKIDKYLHDQAKKFSQETIKDYRHFLESELANFSKHDVLEKHIDIKNKKI